ncbi:hypothetical protein ACFSYD_25680 [Paracoccus aerius]
MFCRGKPTAAVSMSVRCLLDGLVGRLALRPARMLGLPAAIGAMIAPPFRPGLFDAALRPVGAAVGVAVAGIAMTLPHGLAVTVPFAFVVLGQPKLLHRRGSKGCDVSLGLDRTGSQMCRCQSKRHGAADQERVHVRRLPYRKINRASL